MMLRSTFIRLSFFLMLLGFSVAAAANSSTELCDTLVNRSERYIESIRQTVSPEAADRARAVVADGLARLRTLESRNVESFSHTHETSFHGAFQRLDLSSDSPAVQRTMAFLRERFHAPTAMETFAQLAGSDFRSGRRILVLLRDTQRFPEPLPDSVPVLVAHENGIIANGNDSEFLLSAIRACTASEIATPFFQHFKSDRNRLEGFAFVALTTIRRE